MHVPDFKPGLGLSDAQVLTDLLKYLVAFVETLNVQAPMTLLQNSIGINLPDQSSVIPARIIGGGNPITVELSADVATTDSSISINLGSILPTGATIPTTFPFDIIVGTEPMVATAQVGSILNVSRPTIEPSSSPATYLPTSPAETSAPVFVPKWPFGPAISPVMGSYSGLWNAGVMVTIAANPPLAFIQVTETLGQPSDSTSGVYGTVQSATCAPISVASIQAISSSLVTVTDGVATFAGTSTPAYEINGLPVPVDGSFCAELWLDESGLFYLFSADGRLPIFAFLTASLQSPVTTTLADNVLIGDSDIVVSSVAGFPFVGGAASQGQFLIKIGTEYILVYKGPSYTGLVTDWQVDRGAASSTAAAHTSGDTVTLINPSYGFVQAQMAYPGIFSPMPGGMSSGNDPTIFGNAPAWCMDPLALVTRFFGETAVVLYPGPNTSSGQSWIFQGDPYIPFASIVGGGLLASSDQYVLGAHGFVEAWIGTYSPTQNFPTGLMGSIAVDGSGNLFVSSSTGSISTSGSTPTVLTLAPGGGASIAAGGTATPTTIAGIVQSGTSGSPGIPGGYIVVDSSGTSQTGGTLASQKFVVVTTGGILQSITGSFVGGIFVTSGSPATVPTLNISGGAVS